MPHSEDAPSSRLRRLKVKQPRSALENYWQIYWASYWKCPSNLLSIHLPSCSSPAQSGALPIRSGRGGGVKGSASGAGGGASGIGRSDRGGRGGQGNDGGAVRASAERTQRLGSARASRRPRCRLGSIGRSASAAPCASRAAVTSALGARRRASRPRACRPLCGCSRRGPVRGGGQGQAVLHLRRHGHLGPLAAHAHTRAHYMPSSPSSPRASAGAPSCGLRSSIACAAPLGGHCALGQACS